MCDYLSLKTTTMEQQQNEADSSQLSVGESICDQKVSPMNESKKRRRMNLSSTADNNPMVNCASSTSSTSSSANSFYESTQNANQLQQNLEKIVKESMEKKKKMEDVKEKDEEIEDRVSNSSLPDDEERPHEEFEGESKVGAMLLDNPFLQSLKNHMSGENANWMNLPNFLKAAGNGGSQQQKGTDNSNAIAAFMAMSPFFQQNSGNNKSMSDAKLPPMLAAAAAGFAFNKMKHQTSESQQGHTANSLEMMMKNAFLSSSAAAASNNKTIMHQNPFDDYSRMSPPMSPSMTELDHLPQLNPTNGQQWTFEEQFKQLYELSDDPKRREFLDDLFLFMQKRGTPVNRIPIMAKQVLDLHALYQLVVSRGGLVEVINKKLWREITKGLNLPSSITSAAFTLRTQYMKYLYPYECEKLRLSNPSELQSAIDGNRREARRASYNFDYPPLILSNSSTGQLSPTHGSNSSTNKAHLDFGANGSSQHGNFPSFINGNNSEAMANFLSVSNLFPNGSPFNKSSTPMKYKNYPNENKSSCSPRHMDQMDSRSKSPEDIDEKISFKRQKNSNDDTGHASSNSSEDFNFNKHQNNPLANSASAQAYQKILSAAMANSGAGGKALNANLLNSLMSGGKQKFQPSPKEERSSDGPMISLKTPFGLKNISNSPLKLCIQPGSQIGLPDNAVMSLLEYNGVTYQGVLFSNQSDKKKQEAN